jgi:hypothetical protein
MKYHLQVVVELVAFLVETKTTVLVVVIILQVGHRHGVIKMAKDLVLKLKD